MTGEPSPTSRSRLGLGRTFQRLELFGTLSARENVQMAAEVQRDKLTGGRTPAEEAGFQLGAGRHPPCG